VNPRPGAAVLTDKQLLRFRDFIYENLGLWFGDSKLPVLQNRLRIRMGKLGVDADKYYALIRSEDDRAEIEKLINVITTNETYFYRCESQMDSFREIILPRMVEEKIAAGNRSLKIWSAGCSTGEEPYTLAMCIFETIPFHSIWDILIYATDLSTDVLNRALEGKYNKRAIERMPADFLKKYFDLRENGLYYVNNAIKKVVDFEYSNLVDAYYDTDYDIIFCRNVLIYFRDETKKMILNKFYDALKPGGYMFLGPTEMVRGLVDGFKLISLKDSVVFQKAPR
jgi:chemotaxis protein methyltransferase CheR